MAEDARRAESALENRLNAINAVYRRFGRDGLKDYPLGDVTLLLESKRMELRDAPAGRDVGEPQKAANRLLELEIRDLSGHVDALLSGAGLSALRRAESRLHSRGDRRESGAVKPPRQPGRGLDREA
jgi:hypothetical protein